MQCRLAIYSNAALVGQLARHGRVAYILNGQDEVAKIINATCPKNNETNDRLQKIVIHCRLSR